MTFTKGLGLAWTVAVVAAAAVAAVAFAGTATIHDGRDSGTRKCADIDTVKAKAGHRTTTFHVLMFGNVKARPCSSHAYPSVGIAYRNGSVNCSVHGLKNTGTGEPGLYCGKTNHKEGVAKIAIDPVNDKQWDLSFHTADLPGKPTEFRFWIMTSGIFPGDETSGSAGQKLITIG